MTLAEYFTLLASHDWLYQWSDVHSYWQKQNAVRMSIYSNRKESKDHENMYNDFKIYFDSGDETYYNDFKNRIKLKYGIE